MGWQHINVQCPRCGRYGYWPRLPKVVDRVIRARTPDGRKRTLWVLECQRCGHIWEYMKGPDLITLMGVPKAYRAAVRRLLFRGFVEQSLRSGEAPEMVRVSRDGVFIGDRLYLWPESFRGFLEES